MPLVRKPTQTTAQPKTSAGEILKALESPISDERWAAARAAVEIESSTDALGAALAAETDPRVREAIFTSLARIGTRESVGKILPLLRSNEAASRMGALDALRSSIDATRELLPELLSDPDADVRISSCELVRSLPSDEGTRRLCAVLSREQDINVCAAAIEVLAEVGNQEALAALSACGQRFAHVPFLSFAVKVATDRITAALSRG
jgi:HEAT repeat protein